MKKTYDKSELLEAIMILSECGANNFELAFDKTHGWFLAWDKKDCFNKIGWDCVLIWFADKISDLPSEFQEIAKRHDYWVLLD